MEPKIWQGLIDLRENLNKLRRNIPDSEQQGQIQEVINDIEPRLEEEVKKQLDEYTKKYQGALDGLENANKAVLEAMKDLNKVAQAIKAAAEAAKAADVFLAFCM